MAKTNKSFSKRLKITKRGKILSRIPGQNHFNAKVQRVKQLHQKGLKSLDISVKTLKRFMPTAKI